MAVLNVEAVRAIRASADTQKELAERFGICQATVSQVVRRVTWREVES